MVARDLLMSILIWKLFKAHRRYSAFKSHYRQTAAL